VRARDGGFPTERHGLNVVVLEASAAVAPLARLELPLAASARAPPDLALHRGRDGLPLLLARKRLAARAGLRQRLLDQTLALRVLGEDEVETALQDLRRGPIGTGVAEGILRRLELVEEAARDRDVQARELRVEELHAFDRLRTGRVLRGRRRRQ
jgi:hypothetical protein